MTTRLAVLLVLAVLSGTAPALEFSSGPARTSLLELYTSEGCSSCPPADAWLRGLREDPRLWQRLVPVAFHVDYWNQLGWPDRFSRSAFSARQRRHRSAGGVASVYTPGFVVDGREWRGWFARQALPEPAPGDAGVLQVRVDDTAVSVNYEAGDAGTGLVVHVALLGFDLVSEVRAGENRGRELRHDFVVLEHLQAPLVPGPDGHAASLAAASLPAGDGRRAIAVWVTRGDRPAPLQAGGAWLP